MSYRIGHGYDSHEFTVDIPLKLGGIEIPHTHGLAGHSDGDVILHALTDALLGAVAAGDIGGYFPPSDPKWKGASSRVFLEKACALVRARGGAITQYDRNKQEGPPDGGPSIASPREAGLTKSAPA